MAIIDVLPGVEVTITVNGEPLKEHHDPDLEDDPRTKTLFVEAVSGQKFEVQIKVKKGVKISGDVLVCRIYVDGSFIDGAIIQPSHVKTSDHIQVSQGKILAQNRVQNYQFDALETVIDGRALINEASKVKELGTISVVLTYETRLHRTIRKELQSSSLGIVAEKVIKGRGLTHSVNLSDPVKRTTKPTEIWNTTPVQGLPHPLARFVFCYRSLEALKSMRIIPRTPTPPPLEERDGSTLTHDEVRELQKRLKAMVEKEATAVKVKRERQDENPRPRKVARPSTDANQLELDEEGRVRERSTPTLMETEVIEID